MKQHQSVYSNTDHKNLKTLNEKVHNIYKMPYSQEWLTELNQAKQTIKFK